MPSYVGIGTSITHNVEVDGNLFLQDIEGGPDSTRVPLEIFSNLVSSSVEAENSRMLRLRVQNYGETNTDNSYVTDMGIRGEASKDYFFITAPQNTSNVGDQNTFVISRTSNVGIGTTDPTKPLHVVGDSWITGTLTTSNIVGSSFLTVTANTNVVAEFTESTRYYHVKEPRSAMNADSSFGYTASASSNHGYGGPWYAFNHNTTSDDQSWHAVSSRYDNNGNYTYSPASSIGGYTGEWLKIQMPSSIKLEYIVLYGRMQTYASVLPVDGTVLGSTDGSNWTAIKSWSNYSYSTGVPTTIQMDSTNYYNYFVIVVEKIGVFVSGDPRTPNIGEWELYGTPYTAATNDGTDVLHKTVPNTPKAEFLEVYYDAREYSGSGNITDETGNGNTGTPTNVTFTSTEPKTFEFNGTSSYISATFNSNTLNTSNLHSICMWIKPNAIQSGYKSLFSMGENISNKLMGIFLNGGYVVYLSYGNNLISDYLVETDKWHFITCTYTPGRKIYVNSQLVTSDAYSTFNITNFSAKLGANVLNAELFDGSIANFRFYDRPLSEDEIWEIYSYQKAYFSVSPDVVTYKAGRVGIGTSEPRAVLDVEGDARISGLLKQKTYACTRYINAGSITRLDGVIIPFDGVVYDPYNLWNTTNDCFVTPISGVYSINTQMMTMNDGAYDGNHNIYINGANYSPNLKGYGFGTSNNGNDHRRATSNHCIALTKGDTVSVHSAGTQKWYGPSGYTYCVISIVLISANL